jgi:CYTH domain-containing protein
MFRGPAKLGNTPGMEIERKFLVAELPDLSGNPGEPIEQGYLALADDGGGAEVRLRRKPGHHLLTVKAGRGRSRAEEEIELDPERFDRLWPLTEGRRVTKTRHRIARGERTIELDLYSGDLDGLAVAEVEFPDDRTADDFEPPEWFGDEVTGERSYLNETLATEGRPR